MTPTTLQTVLRTLQHYKLLSTNQTLIVGVSGGTDSISLLHMLFQLSQEFDMTIHVATLNHGIRGLSAQADVSFVQQLSEQWSLPYTLGHVNVPQLAEDTGRGIEETARYARYDFLAKVAQEHGTQWVAVAHHADDQAETILMHIIRGSGLNGLRGMQIVSPMPRHPQLTLIRPLINIRRVALEQYCIDNQLEPRHDETNEDVNYQRNYIRHEIMPRLEKINSNVGDALLRLSSNATIDDDYLTQLFDEIVMPSVNQEDKRWRIWCLTLLDLPLALQHRFIRTAFEQLNDAGLSLSTHLGTSVIEWLKNAKVGSRLDLGQGVRARMGYHYLYIEDKHLPIDFSDYRLIPQNTNQKISIPSFLLLYDIAIAVSTTEPDDIHPDKILILPDNVDLRLRTRQAGDRFCPLGMKGHSRKIKDWMIDRKIPQQIRNQIPLITMNGVIIAILVGDTWHLADLSQYNLKGYRKIYLILG